MDSETTSAIVRRILAQYLGETMAEASVNSHRERLGIQGPTMTRPQFDELVAKLALGLAVFLGREETQRVVEDIRSAVAAAGGPQ